MKNGGMRGVSLGDGDAFNQTRTGFIKLDKDINMWLTMSLSNVFLSSNITQSQLTQMGNFEYGEDLYIFFLFYNKKKKRGCWN